jgi:hypothetical protein
VKRFINRRPSPALVVAFIALFVAMGGVSYGVATGSIDTREIRNNTIQGKDVRNGTLSQNDLGDSGKPVRRFGPTPIALNQVVTLFSYGGITVVGQCQAVNNSTRFRAVAGLSENGTALGSNSNNEGNIGPATPEDDRVLRVVTSPINEFRHSAPENDHFAAVAPSGRAIEGTIHAAVNGQSRSCRAYGSYVRIK